MQTEEFEIELGYTLCKLRKAKGKSQAEVAKDLGISQTTVANWKSETVKPHQCSIRQIADYFDVSVPELLGDESEGRTAEFGRRLKRLRKSRNVKQHELAAALGLKEAAVSRYECGDREPTLETLVRISEFFGCTVDYLLTGKVPVRRRTNAQRE